jgi:NhaA family Na+:H+ antiporter
VTPPRRAAPLFGRVLRPLQAFFELEAASGLVLLACAVAALVWANAGGAESYRAVFELPLTAGAAGAAGTFTLRQLVNDGLMTVFFFLVGMEIKRELVAGELREPSQALLPAVAAVGGMLVPAGIFLAFNAGGPGQPGWGVPMATDIAFCIGVLTLLGDRVPHALRVFVTALAIFDDIGGILVIAVFYGHGLDAGWLGAAGFTALVAIAMGRAYVRSGAAWALVLAALWWALHGAGIHATIAGVVVGLAVPAAARRTPREVLAALAAHVRALLARRGDEELDAAALLRIEDELEAVEAPLGRFVHALHPWVAYGVMPLFALANSGVEVGALGVSELLGPVAVGAAVALFAGKQIGIFLFTLAAVKLGVARMPGDASLPKLLGVSIVAGIGFTVALFIAGLAYADEPALLDQAKVGILGGSLLAGAVGALVLRLTAPAGARGGVTRATASASS